jgi:hypothetical protein
VWRLYTQHIVARDIQQYEGIRDELYRILKDTAASTGVAGEKASEFDQAIAGAPGSAAIRDTVADLHSDR